VQGLQRAVPEEPQPVETVPAVVGLQALGLPERALGAEALQQWVGVAAAEAALGVPAPALVREQTVEGAGVALEEQTVEV
jgi:hypothetical protein